MVVYFHWRVSDCATDLSKWLSATLNRFWTKTDLLFSQSCFIYLKRTILNKTKQQKKKIGWQKTRGEKISSDSELLSAVLIVAIKEISENNITTSTHLNSSDLSTHQIYHHDTHQNLCCHPDLSWWVLLPVSTHIQHCSVPKTTPCTWPFESYLPHVGSIFKLVLVLLDGIPSFHSSNCNIQLIVTCKIAESHLHSISLSM